MLERFCYDCFLGIFYSNIHWIVILFIHTTRIPRRVEQDQEKGTEWGTTLRPFPGTNSSKERRLSFCNKGWPNTFWIYNNFFIYIYYVHSFLRIFLSIHLKKIYLLHLTNFFTNSYVIIETFYLHLKNISTKSSPLVRQNFYLHLYLCSCMVQIADLILNELLFYFISLTL